MSDTQNDMKMMGENGEKVEMHFPPTTKHSHVFPIVGVIIIMLVLMLGGLVFWGSQLEKQKDLVVVTPIVNNEPETPRAEADIQILQTLSPSDELDAIEADLESTNMDSIDIDLTTIDVELSTALSQ